MTNGWTDIRNADVVLAMGGNPAENHPVGFRFVMEAKRHRNAKLVCVDPRFNLVTPKGRAPTWNQFGNGNWATASTYATSILSLRDEALAYHGLH